MRNFIDYYCFLLFSQSRPGITVPPCILQCASGEGPSAVIGPPAQPALVGILTMPLFRQLFDFLKAFWEGKFLWLFVANSTNKMLAMRRTRADILVFCLFPDSSISICSMSLGFQATLQLTSLLIWVQSSTTCLNCQCDSPESAADHQANASAPSFFVAQMSKWLRRLIWDIFRLFLCHETGLFSSA